MKRSHIHIVVSIAFLVLIAFPLIEGIKGQTTLSSSASTYTMKVNYKISDGGSPAAPIINYVTPQGTQASQTIPLYPNTLTITMGGNKPWSVTPNPLNPSTSTERWYSTQTLQGTTPKSGSTSKTFTFQHQYLLTVNSPYDSPSGTGWYNAGSTAYAQLSKSTVQSAIGTRQVFTEWSGDASGTNTKSNPITMNAPKTATALWKTQYQVTLKVNPAYSGSTTPSGTQYYDSGKNLEIKAIPNGNQFVAWTQTGTITLLSPASQTTTAIINGPGTLTANFDAATQYPTHLTAQVQPAQIGLNQPVTITGLLTDYKNQPLSGKTIFISFTPAANSYGWINIGQATTAKDGTYTLTWTKDMPVGAYFVMAQFAGDTNNKCSVAVASNNGASLTVVPEYTWGALAALGACFAGFGLYKTRNKRQKQI